MITINEFIEKSKPAWKTARAYIQCLDNPNNPTEFKLESDDWFYREKLSLMGLNESDIKYHVLLLVSDESMNRVGYHMMHFYLRSDKTVLCVEFDECNDAFLNITKKLGMVNGVVYKKKISIPEHDSEVFFF